MTNDVRFRINVGDTTWSLQFILNKTNRIGDTKYNFSVVFTSTKGGSALV